LWYNKPVPKPGPLENLINLPKMTALEQRMADDFAWAEHAPEVQQNPDHYGKLVVVYNQRVRAVGTDRMALVQQVAAQEGVPPEHFVVVLVPRPGLWETPH
jgi:hypothetical protein